FGQVFKAGDVPRGTTLSATIHGQSVPLQVDAKATHADGSMRHAVLTVTMASLQGDKTVPLELSASADTSSSAPDETVTLSQLLATPYDATITLHVGGTDYRLDARQLL